MIFGTFNTTVRLKWSIKHTVFFVKRSSFFYYECKCQINDFSDSLEFSNIYREIEIQATNINISELFYSEYHDNIYVHRMFA